jgi:hypothetical protein
MVVLTMLYNLREGPMTVLEQTRLSVKWPGDEGEAAFINRLN